MQETSQSGTWELVTSSTAHNNGNVALQSATQTLEHINASGLYTNPEGSQSQTGYRIRDQGIGQSNLRQDDYTVRVYRPPGYNPPIQEMGTNQQNHYNHRGYRPPGYHPPIQEIGQNHQIHDDGRENRPPGYNPPIQEMEQNHQRQDNARPWLPST